MPPVLTYAPRPRFSPVCFLLTLLNTFAIPFHFVAALYLPLLHAGLHSLPMHENPMPRDWAATILIFLLPPMGIVLSLTLLRHRQPYAPFSTIISLSALLIHPIIFFMFSLRLEIHFWQY